MMPRKFRSTILFAFLIQLSFSFVAQPIAKNSRQYNSILQSSADTVQEEIDYDVPEDAVIAIKPNAMKRLRELREKEKSDALILRMGVRNGVRNHDDYHTLHQAGKLSS
jgi:hypothetical protein